jgi:hypothetical protein
LHFTQSGTDIDCDSDHGVGKARFSSNLATLLQIEASPDPEN